MKVITVATSINTNVERLLHSAAFHKIDMELLGQGVPYREHVDKTKILLSFLRKQPRNQLILFLDAFDSIFLCGLDYIEARFSAFNSSLVMSTEQNFNCDEPFYKKFRYYLDYPPAPSPYRFLNSGGWIGRAGYAADLLEQIAHKNGSEQSHLNIYFAANPSAITLDYNHEIFTCTAGRAGLEDKDYTWKEDGTLINTVTNSQPAIFHAPGKNFIGLARICQNLSWMPKEKLPPRPIRSRYIYSRIMNRLTARIPSG